MRSNRSVHWKFPFCWCFLSKSSSQFCMTVRHRSDGSRLTSGRSAMTRSRSLSRLGNRKHRLSSLRRVRPCLMSIIVSHGATLSRQNSSIFYNPLQITTSSQYSAITYGQTRFLDYSDFLMAKRLNDKYGTPVNLRLTPAQVNNYHNQPFCPPPNRIRTIGFLSSGF